MLRNPTDESTNLLDVKNSIQIEHQEEILYFSVIISRVCSATAAASAAATRLSGPHTRSCVS